MQYGIWPPILLLNSRMTLLEAADHKAHGVEQDFFRWPPVGVSVSGELHCCLQAGQLACLLKILSWAGMYLARPSYLCTDFKSGRSGYDVVLDCRPRK